TKAVLAAAEVQMRQQRLHVRFQGPAAPHENLRRQGLGGGLHVDPVSLIEYEERAIYGLGTQRTVLGGDDLAEEIDRVVEALVDFGDAAMQQLMQADLLRLQVSGRDHAEIPPCKGGVARFDRRPRSREQEPSPQ